jgi:hypothetical protein
MALTCSYLYNDRLNAKKKKEKKCKLLLNNIINSVNNGGKFTRGFHFLAPFLETVELEYVKMFEI